MPRGAIRAVVKECHYDPQMHRCIGDCPFGIVCTGRPSARCLEECKLKFGKCLKDFPEEYCEEIMEECRMDCPLECECSPIVAEE